MPIILRLDRVMADRKMSLNTLSEKVGIANVNLSKIKTGKVSAIRFSTLEAICKALDCQPGDILEYQPPAESLAPIRIRRAACENLRKQRRTQSRDSKESGYLPCRI